MRPLPLELARGNIDQEEDDNQNREENAGVDDNVKEFHRIFKDLERIRQDITTRTLCQCGEESLGDFLVCKGIIFQRICKSFVQGGRSDNFVVCIQFLNENGVKTIFLDGEGKTAEASLLVCFKDLFLTLGGPRFYACARRQYAFVVERHDV